MPVHPKHATPGSGACSLVYGTSHRHAYMAPTPAAVVTRPLLYTSLSPCLPFCEHLTPRCRWWGYVTPIQYLFGSFTPTVPHAWPYPMSGPAWDQVRARTQAQVRHHRQKYGKTSTATVRAVVSMTSSLRRLTPPRIRRCHQIRWAAARLEYRNFTRQIIRPRIPPQLLIPSDLNRDDVI